MLGKLQKIREGAVELLVPRAGRIYDAPVFFNPVMRLNRDISVLVARVSDCGSMLDAFSATGIRGLRYALETDASEIWMNDISRDAFELMVVNSALNLPGASIEISGFQAFIRGERNEMVITRRDANALMGEMFRSFDMVDLDPFGSPVEFLDSALRSVKRRGLLAVTATDTGVLCGAYTKACMKKYLARPLRGELCHETGLRILIGTVVRYAAKYDLGVKVLLAYYRDHYFRIFLELESGARRALNSLKNLGYVYYTGPVEFKYELGFLPSGRDAYGPMWMGPLKDEDFVEKILIECRKNSFVSDDTCSFVELIAKELDVPLFYDTHSIARRLGSRPVKVSELIEKLRENGFMATRTHISPRGIKTTAGLEDIAEIWTKL